MDLTGWLVAWVFVTTVVVGLAYYRLTLGLHEVLGVHFAKPDLEFVKRQLAVDRKLNTIDKLGIALTVVSAAMMLMIVFLWAIESGGVT